jgi:hypothetical protein
MCMPTAVPSRPFSLASGKPQRYDVFAQTHASVPSKLSIANIPAKVLPVLSSPLF